MSHDEALERRFPRRLLLGGGAAAAALAAVEAVRPPPAAAAPGTSPWLLGGNANVVSDGSNWLGPTNAAPLIFKTGRASGGAPGERMRIAATGRVGIGITAPASRLDVRATEAVAVQGTTSASTGAPIAGVRGVASTAGYGVYGASPTSGTGVRGDGSSSGLGMFGTAGYCGVQGEGGSYGGIFYGDNSGAYGLYASGQSTGVYASGNDYGLQAFGSTAVRAVGSSAGTGVSASGSTAVYGSATGTGVFGTTTDPNGKAVWGSGGQYGVYGSDARTAAVRGDSGYVAIWGEGASWGVYAKGTATTGQNYGVWGETASPDGFAMWAQGNLHCTGTVSKAAGSFKIDHPLDPTNRWLSHSFVESPDMMNVYNGNVVLDAHGAATVELPDYFVALNRDHRYQLTCIGGFAPVYVSSKVENNRFSIAGGTPGLEVSWQVTGIRQDDYAKAHPIVVDVPKARGEKGTRQFAPAGSKAPQYRPAPVGPVGSGTRPQVPADAPAPTPARGPR